MDTAIMTIRIVQLGTPRHDGEVLRLGTVRRPPRGVPKENWSKLNYYDVWLPILAPSVELMAQAKAALEAKNAKAWSGFEKSFLKEMNSGDASRTLDLLAALSKTTDLSLGCYCQEESKCHRSLLRHLLVQRHAVVAVDQ